MRFKRIYIEISNICNLSCPFCSELTRPLKSLTEEEFIRIAQSIKGFSSFIYLHVKGEPLLHPLLPRFLDISQEFGFRVNITTNGTLIEKRRELLLSHPAIRQVNISLHAAEFTKSQEEYFRSALSFAKEADPKGIYTILRLWTLSGNDSANSSAKEIMNMLEREYSVPFPLTDKMGGGKSVQLSKNTFVDWEREFVWPELSHDDVSEYGFCYGLKHQVAILVDGTVVPCCLDANGQAPLGNIFETPFEEILSSKKAKAIKHGFERFRAVEPLCRKCLFKTKFDARLPENIRKQPQ